MYMLPGVDSYVNSRPPYVAFPHSNLIRFLHGEIELNSEELSGQLTRNCQEKDTAWGQSQQSECVLLLFPNSSQCSMQIL